MTTIPNENPANAPGIIMPPTPAEKRPVSMAEKLLLPLALLVAVLCDRLIANPVLEDFEAVPRLAGAFWLSYLVAFYAFYWKRLARNRALWYVGCCCAALCAWNFVFPAGSGNDAFRALTYFVVPAVLMAHAQLAAGEYKLKDAGKVAAAWLLGWFVKPVSGIPAFGAAIGGVLSGGEKTAVKKIALGVGITLPLLCMLVPLLSGADRMFGYFLGRIMGEWEPDLLVFHGFVILIAAILFYSFFWNVGFGKNDIAAGRSTARIDVIVCRIVLGSVALLYVLFCAVQFTYLFAGAGLPDGMTYSEYAREGFAQTVAVCAINLLIFGVFLRYGVQDKSVRGLLAGLLALTGVMLFSGALRLLLYVEAYGLTWLRVLSAWFVIYLAAVVILSCVRMVKEKLPAVALAALILLGWYVALGFSNPDALITRYNMTNGFFA